MKYSNNNNNNNNSNNNNNNNNSNNNSNNKNNNSNNRNNNSSNNNENSVKLNSLVFNDILPLIICSCNFQRLLDLSLISKSTFKSVQLCILNKQKQIKFYPYDNQILYYIKKSIKYNPGSSSGSGGSSGTVSSENDDDDDDDDDHQDEYTGDSENETENYSSGSSGGSASNQENSDIEDHRSGNNSEEHSDGSEIGRNDTNQIDSSNGISGTGGGGGYDDENDMYRFKLIQFDKLSILYLKKYYHGYGKKFAYLKDESINYDNLKELKKILIKLCNSGGGIKKVCFVNYVSIALPDTLNLNLSCGGFYQFKKVFTYWGPECPPCSTEEEDIEVNDYADELDEDFELSFKYLRRINPKKFKLSTSVNEIDIHLSLITNILKCKSLESIKFGYHNTDHDDFIVRALSSKSPQLKELTIRPNSGKSIADALTQSDIVNNKSLKKLVLRRQVDFGCSIDLDDPSFAIKSLIGNKSIRRLGLELYKLLDYKLLLPLVQLPNIKEISCDIDSTIPFLLHCNENPNIKVLHINNNQLYNTDKSNGYVPKEGLQQILEFFSIFITQNQTLKYIKITASQILYNKLNHTLKKSKLNNAINGIKIIKPYNLFNQSNNSQYIVYV